MSCRHLSSYGHPHGITNSLPKGPGGAFNTRGFHIFRMARSLTVQLPKVLNFFHREIKSREMEPSIKEHTSMTRRENKPIAVDPLGIGWIDL
jgi:hypothetical protein